MIATTKPSFRAVSESAGIQFVSMRASYGDRRDRR
jgi:hypothetical protein